MRLRFVEVPGDRYVLVFDQADSRDHITALKGQSEGMKAHLDGCAGVLFLDEIELEKS